MAQKEIQKSGENSKLEEVPKKAGLLDQIDAELVQVGYENVGQVVGGSLNIKRGPLKLGLGMGGERMEYLDESQFYLAPKLEVRGILGDFELYATGNTAITLEGNETRAKINAYGTLGGVWEALPKTRGNGFMLRIGSEIEGEGEFINAGGFEGSRGIPIARLGAAIGYGALTGYAIEDVIFLNDKVYSNVFADVIDGHHHKLRVGIVFNKSGISAGGEFFQTSFGKGGELSFESRHTPLKWAAWYSREDEVWGGERKMGISLTMPLGFGEKRYAPKHPIWGTGRPIAEDTKEKQVSVKYTGKRWEFFRDAVLASENISELAQMYRGMGGKEILLAAALLAEWGVGNYEKESAKAIRELGVEGSYENVKETVRKEAGDREQIRAFILFANEVNLGDETRRHPNLSKEEKAKLRELRNALPDYLKNDKKLWNKKYYKDILNYLVSEYEKISPWTGGAGVCRNINPMQATFLRESGWEAFSIGVFGGKEAHIATLARNPKTGKTALLDYGDIIKSPSGKFWPLIRNYAKGKGFVPTGVEIWGENNEFVGYYELEEGKMARAKAGDEDTLKDALLHSRPRKK